MQAFSYSVSPQEPRYADLTLHGCPEAADLLLKHPRAWRAYTDGSGLHENHNGSAVVLVDPLDPGARVFSHRIREDSSYPAELYALLLALKRAPRQHALIILSDCSAALQKFHSVVQGTCVFYSHTHSFILRQIKQAYLLREAPTHYAHIRSHVGFAGNEWADIFAKHAAYCPFPPPPQMSKFDLHQRSILIQGKPHFHLFRRKISRHAHPDLHTRSFDLWRYSSFFSRLSFSWPNGLVNIPTYEFFNTMDERWCSLCNLVHPFDALSSLAQCAQLAPALDLAFQVWPLPAQGVVRDWFRHTGRDSKRKFVRTLLPLTLTSVLHNVNGLSLSDMLAHRKPLLPGLLKAQYQSLWDRPAPPNRAGKGPTNFYNTNTTPVIPPPKRYSPPTGIPVSFELRPPQEKRKRKRAATPPPGVPKQSWKRPRPSAPHFVCRPEPPQPPPAGRPHQSPPMHPRPLPPPPLPPLPPVAGAVRSGAGYVPPNPALLPPPPVPPIPPFHAPSSPARRLHQPARKRSPPCRSPPISLHKRVMTAVAFGPPPPAEPPPEPPPKE